MSLTTLGEVLDGEVVGRNNYKGSVWLMLDSGEKALLPQGRMQGANRFDELIDGSEIKVKVIVIREGTVPGEPFILVTEDLDAEPERDEADEPSVPRKASPELVRRYPRGMRVKGKIESVRSDALLVEIADGVIATLPFSELDGSKPGSFRRGVNVKAQVLSVGDGGIKLTRRSIEVCLAA